MMLYIQLFLQMLLVELLGVGCVASILYIYWNSLSKKRK